MLEQKGKSRSPVYYSFLSSSEVQAINTSRDENNLAIKIYLEDANISDPFTPRL